MQRTRLGMEMLASVTATEARVHFGELLQRVGQGEKGIVVKRLGQPVAVILSIDEYERLVLPEAKVTWTMLLQYAHEHIRAELGDRKLMPADEAVRLMREERAAEMLGFEP